MDYRLVTAYALAASIGLYFDNKGNKKFRYMRDRRGEILEPFAIRIAMLANQMHDLTGNKAYRDLANAFTNTENWLHPPSHPLHGPRKIMHDPQGYWTKRLAAKAGLTP